MTFFFYSPHGRCACHRKKIEASAVRGAFYRRQGFANSTLDKRTTGTAQ